MKPLVVISFYDRRPIEPLIELLDSLDRHPSGAPYERVICVNSTGSTSLPDDVRKRVDGVLERPNVGMNIGAWDAGWRHWPGRDAYLFLQDECYAVREGWMQLVLDGLADAGVGLVGEALNPAWDRSWDELRQSLGGENLPEHVLDGKPANRVDVYLDAMRRYGIDPGTTGRHLRSLVWGIRGEVLRAIGGFPQGGNYGECIAAEIGVSRAVEARGYAIRQLGGLPFHVFRHREWNQDRPGGPFTHRPVLLRDRERMLRELQQLRSRLEHPRWSDLGRGLLRRLRLASGGRS